VLNELHVLVCMFYVLICMYKYFKRLRVLSKFMHLISACVLMVHRYECMHVCMYVCMCACVCVCVYV
jgi:hypothetical protein